MPMKTGKKALSPATKAPAPAGPSIVATTASLPITATSKILNAFKDIQTQLKAITDFIDKIEDHMFTSDELKLVGKDFDELKKDLRHASNTLYDHNEKMRHTLNGTRAELKQEFHDELGKIRRHLGSLSCYAVVVGRRCLYFLSLFFF